MFNLSKIAKAVGSLFAVVVLTMGFISVLAPTSAKAEANGWNTTVVEFAGGSFELNQSGVWLEFASGNPQVRYRFRETSRDEWSVYGRDASRNMDIQLDMYRKKIRLAWPGHPMQDQYNITNVSDKLNARQVRYVAMTGKSFTQEGNDWVERDASNNVTARFRKASRDVWSVYARDDSRNMKMQLDLYRRVIRLSWPGQELFDWAPITDVR
jgi:hypothetical protein